MKVKALHVTATLAFTMIFAGAVLAQSSQQQPPPPAQPTPTQPSAAAQQPPPPQTPAQSPQRTPVVQGELRSMDGQTVTLTGCLLREEDVPGRTPTPVERAGIMRDYILANVQMRSASPSGATPTPPDAPPVAPSNIKVKLTKIDGDKARDNLNKQIEVTGRLEVDDEDVAAAPPPGAPARAASKELPKLEVASLRVLGQSCTAQ